MSTDDPTSTSASSDSTTSSSSSSSSCEHTITVSNCQITCTDTVTAGSVASQSSCYTGDCGSRVTGCSGEVTGTTTTTRTTTSASACPYSPPAVPWWTDEDQLVPTVPSYEEAESYWMQMYGSMTGADSQPANTVSSASAVQSTSVDSQAAEIGGNLVSIINDPLFTSSLAPTTSSMVPTTSPETSSETVPPTTANTIGLDSDTSIDLISEPTLGPGGWDMSKDSCIQCSNDLKEFSVDRCMPEKLKSCRIMLCKADTRCQECGVKCNKLYS